MSVKASTAATTATQLITGEELYEMGDIGRCELVAGKIVHMIPNSNAHRSYTGNMCVTLREFVLKNKLGKVRSGEVGIYVRRNPDTIRGADVLFIPNERYAQKTSTGFLDVAPDLVVEVLSRSDRWTSVMHKLREYFAIDVRLGWIVDPGTRSVFAYRSLTDVRAFAEQEDLPGDEVLPGFTVKVAALFEE